MINYLNFFSTSTIVQALFRNGISPLVSMLYQKFHLEIILSDLKMTKQDWGIIKGFKD